jgi:hypothetical protein
MTAVLTAQRGLNLSYGFDSLRARLPFPEHHESLTANAAMHFGVATRTLAEHLHISCLRPPDSHPYESQHIPYLRPLHIPSIGSFRGLLSYSWVAFLWDVCFSLTLFTVPNLGAARLPGGTPSILIVLVACISLQPSGN